ncbi:phosphoglucosamine mutase [Paraclostridium bifermentans]|uniref:phosphoglucosamine mutase n=1 Tax=Paraclostridium TaxID=1849822 RepID=UPI001CC51F67|nr:MULTISPECIES: phosphoglucosamine mutase [Paraclostridium]MBZ6006377.1 phosphoglucosamine mutase [Paraclostridium bifermentans]MCR1876837.1 phosphoglucosamine mutase [Paraclostridium bifermentans]MDU0297323.1 phosphoglucosamine mutase [Paraclostridium sp. MRS3W1]GKZ03955.1 phosphoglucosamine mutase [Paraclostridium bifermentans]GKZ07080.1 phosphoglucosamine mutase [Paraclostridium bifermentans]
MRKYFGTDGVRGIANTELNCDLAYKLGRAGGYVLTKGKDKVKVVVGKDTRVSGDMLESALIAGLMSVGCDIITVGVIPTPGVAYLTKHYNADCGVVISASHNPVEYNGIKFFNEHGYKLDDSIELEIESYIDDIERVEVHPTGDKVGKKIHEHDAVRDYVDYLKTIVNIDFNGLKVVLDCANGAAYKVAPMVFEELGADVVAINNTPDGNNINDKCGSTHPEGLQEAVLKNKADLGLAYDGDADRLIAVNEKGQIVDGDHIMILSAIYLKKQNKLAKDTLVVTVMSNIGLVIAAKENNINLATTAVGDRYVLEEMKNSGYNLGGEQSGHMIFLDYNTTGDGTLSSLVLAQIVKEEGKTLSELAAVMNQYPQVLVNARIKNENKNRYMEIPEIKDEIERIEKLMDGCGRVLIRPSGTEPLVRVMLEGKDEGQLKELATNLANLIQEKLS